MEINGFDAAGVVEQLMQLEARPLTALQTRKDSAKLAVDALDKIRSQVDAFRLAAAKLTTTTAFDRYRATSSQPDAVSVSVTGSASIGALSFTVDQLARPHGLRSVGTVSSSSIAVTSADVLSIATGARSHGVEAVRAGAGLSTGTSAISISQSSAGARVSGSVPLAGASIVAGVNDRLDVVVDGLARVVTIPAGVYDAAGLASAVQSAIGPDVAVSVDDAGVLSLTTLHEGSTASIEVTSATAPLGLVADGPHSGTDAIVDAGGGPVTLSSLNAGDVVSLGTGSGTIDVTLAGGLRAGSFDVTTVATGDRSLADVASAITKAGVGVSAAAVKVADGAWRLQLTATGTGTGGAIAIDGAVLDGIGGLVQSSAAADARITVGEGDGAYSIEASGNTFTDVVPGVSVSVSAVTSSPVTVSVERDDAALAQQVADLVSAANSILGNIRVQTRWDVTAGTGGPLVGNSLVRRLADQVRSALGGQVVGLGTSLPSDVGISMQRDGSFTFDRSKFMSTIADDPDAVARLFSRGGTGTGGLQFAAATSETVAGIYAVEVTSAATRATSTVLSTAALSPTTLGVRVGDTTVQVEIDGTLSDAQLVDALNDELARAGLDLVAETDPGGFVVRADAWGSAGDFELNLDAGGAGSWNAVTGSDVIGTIDGIAATGSGRRLTLPAGATSDATGLAVEVPEGVTGPIGTIEFVPGIAARIEHLATALTSSTTGALTTAKASADAQVERFNDQIERFEDRLAIREAGLLRRFSALQSLLGQMQSQGSWLSGQLASLPKNWSGS